ncbi:hypothetical protein DM02DRAFT_663915 [Periconia macrospinosa]|uniref:Xylanolytic transcriptional activator regulatory domain-containing protein n=1 Tax=Periconia macrospinosa TaxID=97972 RepID=A0A2V1D0G3_9PLEO|nr:hypothetical protein DM02DRAFT_663915 [Periconia macrospinosa]
MSTEQGEMRQQCENCAKGNKHCLFITSSTTLEGVSHRKESVSVNSQDASTERSGETARKRRRIDPLSAAHRDSVFPDEDILHPQVLTLKTCLELASETALGHGMSRLTFQQFDIFQQHFATDLPFLHAPTFKETLKRGNVRALNDSHLSRMCAFVALTSPFHPSFARSSLGDRGRYNEATENANRYAKLAHSMIQDTRHPTLETTQALVMLAFHEWKNMQGARSSRTLSCAITDAQFLGCHIQDDFIDGKHTSYEPLEKHKNQPYRNEQWVEVEAKRRVFWSCYILDSFFCSIKRRPPKICEAGILIQLPCSERAFKHGKNVRTRTLLETKAEFEKRRTDFMRGAGASLIPESKQSSQVIDIKWEDEDQQETFCWNEIYDPWEEWSEFYKLRTALEALIDKIPNELRLCPSHTRVHIEGRTSTSYTLLHSVLANCDISLHREYLPFAPFGRDSLNGPMDEPLIRNTPDDPEFWDKSAQRCFKAARNIIELMWSCNQSQVLVESPLAAFAIYSSLFTVIWCKFFHQFDTAHHLCTDGSTRDKLLLENADRASQMLYNVEARLKMTTPWIKTIHRLHEFLTEAKNRYEQPVTACCSSSAEISSPTLVEYKAKFEMD